MVAVNLCAQSIKLPIHFLFHSFYAIPMPCQLFVNIVKYRLDQVQRRLEAEQRKTTSRASFKCPSCAMTYTDLEVDRLLDPENPGRLICVYCQAEVVEEKDNASRTDARALIAKFHHQVCLARPITISFLFVPLCLSVNF